MLTIEEKNSTHEPEEEHPISLLWFFIGLILVLYGIVLFMTGFIHYIEHQPFHTVLANLQPDMMWGAVLFIIGFLFCTINIARHRCQKKRMKNNTTENKEG